MHRINYLLLNRAVIWIDQEEMFGGSRQCFPRGAKAFGSGGPR
jgi:hypothetical protein